MTADPGPLRDPLRRALPAELVETFEPLGDTLCVETNSREVLEACRSSFAAYRPGYSSGSSPLVLRLLADPALDDEPPWPAPVFRARDHLFYVSLGRSAAVADLASGSAIGFVSGGVARDAHLLRTTFVDCLVLTLLTHGPRPRRTYVHASAAARRGRGLIFSGPSRSGKSTLALACVRRGFDLVSDDVVYLEAAAEQLTVWGKPWRLRILPEAIRLFPELDAAELGAPRDGDDSIELEVEARFPKRVRASCRPAALLFLERRGGAARLTPLDGDRALELLCRDQVFDVPEALAQHRRVWGDLVRHGAFRFDPGEDLEAAVSLLERFLDARTE